MIKRQNNFKNLKNVNVFKEDINNDYIKIYELPDNIGQGKHSFLLDIKTNEFVNESQIKVELISSKGNVIYTEYPKYREGNLRRVAIWVYNSDDNGTATLSIVGELKSVPDEWKGVYNVRTSATININKKLDNISPIRFYIKPDIEISELRKPYVSRSWTGGSLTTFTGSKSVGFYSSKKNKYYINITDKDISSNIEKDGIFQTANPNPPDTLSKLKSQKVNKEYFTSKIEKVINPNLIRLEDVIYTSYEDQDYTIQYTTPPTFSVTENYQSYADINITNMEAFSGNIFRIKTYLKSKGIINDNDNNIEYNQIDDSVLTSKELLSYLDTGSYIDINTGQLKDTSSLDYWTLNYDTNNWEYELSNDYFINNIRLHNIDYNNKEYFSIESNLRPLLYSNTQYNISFNAQTTVTSSIKKSELDIYLINYDISGSLIEERLVGTLETDISKNYENVQAFNAINKIGYYAVRLVAKSGDWRLSDISLKQGYQSGFSVNSYNYRVPIPTWARFDDLDFRIDFYDKNNNKAPNSVFINNIHFTGSNVHIDGPDNLIKGQMYLNDKLYNGIVLGPGMVRNYGYNGWDTASMNNGNGGFMLWSGSVLPGETSQGIPYKGVGLELHDGVGSGSLIFKTDPSILEIKTQNFFFGSDNQYVSGADGNIEISSSNFWLKPDGTVIVTGVTASYISASVGNIGGWSITTGSLFNNSGSNYIGMSTVGDTAFFAGATSLSNSGSAVFNVKHDGTVTMSAGLITSNVVVQGSISASTGNIGGWTITTGSLFDESSGSYTGMSTTGDTAFFAGINELSGSGSALFNVKDDGSMTASNALITGEIHAETGSIDGKLHVSNFIIGLNISSSMPLPINPEAIYPLDSGSTLDQSGNNYNLTSSNIQTTSNRFNTSNKAIYFNSGSNSYVTASNDYDVYVDNGFAVSIWISSEIIGSDTYCIMDNYSLESGSWRLSIDGNQNRLKYSEYSSSTSYDIYTNPFITQSQWYHVVVQRDLNSQSGSIYINSQLNVSNSIFETSSTVEDSYYTGSIDDIKIYSRTLTQIEINDLYAEGSSSQKNGIYLDGRNYWFDDGEFAVGNTTQFMKFSGSVLRVGGAIFADTGSITGKMHIGDNIVIGENVDNSGSQGIVINENNYWKVSESIEYFRTGDSSSGLFWNGNSNNLYLLGRFINSESGEFINNYVNKGNWNIATQYYLDELVYYSSSTFAAIQNNIGQIPISGSSYWALFAEAGGSGSAGTPGTDAEVVKISGDNLTFIFSGSLDPNPTSQIAIFTASLQGITPSITSMFWELKDQDGNIVPNTHHSGVWNGSFHTLILSCSAFVNEDSRSIEISAYSGSVAQENVFDRTTIYKLIEGENGLDAFTFILDNPATTLPSDYTGSVTDYSDAFTDITIFEGSLDITSDFTISITGSSTSVIIADVTQSIPRVRLREMTGSIDTGYINIKAEDTGNPLRPILLQKFTFSKSKTGEGGSGLDAKVLTLNSNTQIFSFGNKVENDILTASLTASVQNLSNLPIWTFTTNDGKSVESTYYSSSNYNSLLYKDAFGSTTSSITVKATVTEGDTYTDYISIYRIDGGQDSVTGFLTNESHTVTTNTDGTGGNYSTAGGDFIMYYGSENITTSSFTTYNSGSIVGGLTASINVDSGSYTITDLSSDNGSIEFYATYDNGIIRPISITKSYTIAKSKAGQDGAGSDARVLTLNSNTQIFKFNNSEFSLSDIISTASLTASLQNITSSVTWSFTTNDGKIVETGYYYTNSEYAELYRDAFGETSESISIRASAYQSSQEYVDYVSIYRVNNGENSIIGFLTNESHTVATNYDGSGGNYSSAGGNFNLFLGFENVTTSSFVTYNSSSITGGLTASINVDSGSYIITNLSASLGTIDFSATYNDGVKRPVTITKTYTIAKSFEGIPGVTGSTGIDGPGLTFRGEWKPNTQYTSSNARKDTTITSSIYYLCNTTHVSSPAFTTDLAYWDNFGQQYESVATDILLAQTASITDILTIGRADDPTTGAVLSLNAFDATYENIGIYNPTNFPNPLFLLDYNGITSISGSIGGWLINREKIVSPGDFLELNSVSKSIYIKNNNGDPVVTIASGTLSINNYKDSFLNPVFSQGVTAAGEIAEYWSGSYESNCTASVSSDGSAPSGSFSLKISII